MEKESDIAKELIVRPPYLCTIKISGYHVNIFSEFDGYLSHFENKNTSYVNDIPGWSSSRHQDIQESSNIPAIFTLHASSIAIDKKGVLMIGDGGSGKTAIALGMAKRYDCEFISNDLSIVSHEKDLRKAFLLESSKIVRLRLATVKLNFPDFLDMFRDYSKSAWTTKIPVKLDVLGLKSTNEPRLIQKAFVVHLDSNPNEPLVLERVSDIETQFALYENLSRIVRGSAISVFDGTKSIMGYMPSLDTKDIHQNRVVLINYLINVVGIWNISGGNLDQICKTIKEITANTPPD